MSVSFENPWALILIPLWAACITSMFLRQRGPLAWIKDNVSPRFRRSFSVYGPVTLWLHMAFLIAMGTMLIAAAAGPAVRGTVDTVRASPRVLLVFDASFSMLADDGAELWAPTKLKKNQKVNRFNASREAGKALVEALGDARIGLITFSGVAGIHLPPTTDRAAVNRSMTSMNVHYFQSTGSNFEAALKAILQLKGRAGTRLQAVIFSDGEMPRKEELGETLAVLEKAGVVLWTVGAGSSKPAALGIYSPEDLRAGVKKPRVVRSIETKRVESTLREMASATGGSYVRLEAFQPDKLAEQIKNTDADPVRVPGEGKDDLSSWFLGLFLILLLAECFLLEGRLIVPLAALIDRFKPGIFGQVLRRLRAIAPSPARGTVTAKAGAALMAFWSVGCKLDSCRAHALNEQGVTAYSAAAFPSARSAFEASATYHVKEEIPTYNLAGATFKQGDHAAAHEAYERALRLRADFPEAYFNDGHALFVWGQKEIDPEGCNLERTKKLWTEAAGRFVAAKTLSPELAAQAEANANRINDALAALEALAQKCPPEKKNKKKPEQKPEKKDKPEDKNDPAKKDPGKDDPAKSDPGKSDPKTGGDPGDQNGAGRPKLSPEEQKQVKGELERMEKQRGGKPHYQTRPQQFRPPEEGKPEDGGKGGREVLW